MRILKKPVPFPVGVPRNMDVPVWPWEKNEKALDDMTAHSEVELDRSMLGVVPDPSPDEFEKPE